MAAFMLYAASGQTLTTQECDTLAPSIESKYTQEVKDTYKEATSTKCQETYTMYPRDQIVGHTGTNGWAMDDPAEGSAGWSLVSHGIGQKLFTLNEENVLVPSAASGVVKSDDCWVVTLESDNFFSDGSPVTAEAVKTGLQRTNEKLDAAQSEVGIMTFTVQDDVTLKICTEDPTPAIDVVLANWPFVIYKAGPSGDIETSRVFSGPYAIASSSLAANGAIAIVDDTMDLEPNSFLSDAGTRVPMKIRKYADASSVAAALKAGEIDMGFNLPSDEVYSLNWHNGVQVKSFLSEYEYMTFFNTQKPALSELAVRKALSLAIDRTQLSAAVAPTGLPEDLVAGMAATGAFPSSTVWGAGRSMLATDTAEAATLLTSAGWVIDNTDGFRKKDGVTLALDIVYYTFRPDLVTMAPLIQASYVALGIDATIRVNDEGNFIDGSPTVNGQASGFDILMWAQNTLPAGDPYWFLNTFFKCDEDVSTGNWGQKNFAQYCSTTIDDDLAAIETAEGDARTAAVTTAHDAILAEYPVTFLNVPVWHAGLRDRMSTYEPWGSDYYVIKTDAMPASICSECTTSDDNTDLKVAIGVLGGVTGVALIAAVAVYMTMKNSKAGTAVTVAKSPPSASSPA